MILYNLGIDLLEAGIKFSGHWNGKNKLWADGRVDILGQMRSKVKPEDKIFWVHAASVGEFEQGRPIIEKIKETHPEYKVLLTFYSPSGYELRKDYQGADYIFYFPSDKTSVVKKFLDIIHPEIAVFIKYEFWINTLKELKNRGIRTFLVSSVFLRDSIFFKPWGIEWRKALTCFETIFVQNASSMKLLETIGVKNVVVAGDTRFDRVASIARNSGDLALVEKFSNGKRVFVAGSTWEPDEEILVRLINENPDTKFIIAPHEIDKERIMRLSEAIKGGVSLYSSPDEDMVKRQVLIVDTIGLLSTIYKYASWAYVGGGFGAGIHNTVEPATYGLPIAFGPKYKKFNEAVTMLTLGIAVSVKGYEDLSGWFLKLKNDENLRLKACNAAKEYTESQLGATESIFNKIGL